MDFFVVAGIVIAVILLFFMIGYNSIIRLAKKVERSKSSIDVYLTQRFDLIPNLIECVKGYMEYEKETFERITQLRSQYMNTKSIKGAALLESEFNKVIIKAENYPELKASEHFLNLQKNLTKMEDQLQAARRIYNLDVTNYNTKISTFPSNIIASWFGLNKEKELFKAEVEANSNIKVDL